MVKTTYDNQQELLSDLMGLYKVRQFSVDPCYSVGNIWKSLPQPYIKFDIKPQHETVNEGDARHLPLADNSQSSVFFDPPFIIDSKNKKSRCHISDRFGSFESRTDLESMYADSIREFSRILVDGGVLVVKCQDTIDCHKQILTHVTVINECAKNGLVCHDVFIYVNENVIHNRQARQVHARKTHSYFMVFVKNRNRID